MILGLLLAVFLVCLAGSWFSFTDWFRQSVYYVPSMVVVSVLTGLLFAFGCQLLDDKRRIFVYSLGYDCAMAVAYYVVPVLFFGCHVRPSVLVAAGLISLAILILHLGE